MTFGEKLKKLRADSGLTQDELAEKLYVTRTAISKWETDRGYPNVESLKAIAKCFSITVDMLLSSEEVLTIAEEYNKQQEKSLRDLVYSLLDISIAMLLLLPFFAESTDGTIRSVSLIALQGVQPYLKTAYLVTVIAIFLNGIAFLALQNCGRSFWRNGKVTLSLTLSVLAVLLFIISSQPYAAVFTFVSLMIKVFMMIRTVSRR